MNNSFLDQLEKDMGIIAETIKRKEIRGEDADQWHQEYLKIESAYYGYKQAIKDLQTSMERQ